MKRCVCIWLVLSCVRVFEGQAQEKYNFVNTALTFLSVNLDARTSGMGELSVASLPDGGAHIQNASKYIFADNEIHGGVQVFYVPWLRDLVGDMYIAGASGFYRIDKQQSVSASFRYFSMGDLQQIDENVQEVGLSSPHEFAFDVAYARRLGRSFSMSVGLRYAVSDVAGVKFKKARVMAFDLDGYYEHFFYSGKIRGRWSMGFSLSNVGEKVDYGNREKSFLPTELKLGGNVFVGMADYHRIAIGVETGRLLVSTDIGNLNKSVFGNIAASFSDGAFLQQMHWKTGMEYGYRNTLFARVGYSRMGDSGFNRQHATFGAGISFKRIQFDGSYLVSVGPTDFSSGNTFRLSVGMVFFGKK